MLWRVYYAIRKNNYLKVSTIMIVTCSILAAILNIESNSCVTKINSLVNELKNKTGQQLQQPQQQQQKQITPQQAFENQSEKEKRDSFALVQHCFLITNLYVYTLYGIIIGVIIIIIWYIKYKSIWSKGIKKIDK
ncbi:MAG: hypothetical protein ACTHL3_06645 [Candidatus Nitrosocosmicus sp.]